MIRLSVTMLDSYLYWRESEMELDELVARIKGEAEPTQEMLAGHAFHKLLEHASAGEFTVSAVDGFEFEFALDQEFALPEIRELKGEHVFETPVGPVTLVGKVDGLSGISVRDYKLTERFDAERYTDSYQWRSYLTMFSAEVFIYDVFQARYDGPRVVVYDYHQLRLHAYPAMAADVHREVCGLAEIVAKYVPEKIQEAA
ncbi:MAG TPA: hypothetical protein VF193_00855 [Steroidobacter sp.]